VNLALGSHKEGTQQAGEAVGTFERLGDLVEQAECLLRLARRLLDDKQLDAAEEATIRSIKLLGEGQEVPLCESHRTIANILYSKGEREGNSPF
jgi:hypothetical protein